MQEYASAQITRKVILCVSFPLKLNFDLDRGVFPMVIQAVVDEGDGRSPTASLLAAAWIKIWKNVSNNCVLLKIASDMLTYFWQRLKEYVWF